MSRPPNLAQSHPFLFLPFPLARSAVEPHLRAGRGGYHVSDPRIGPPRFISERGRRPPGKNVRLQFHKILSEGRSVRYDDEEDVLHLNVIVTKDEIGRSRKGRTT